MTFEVGIRSWGVAVPRRRLPNKATEEAWGRPGVPGARRIAGHDEDAITLGVQAALEATRAGPAGAGFDTGTIDALIFASTTAPLAEKSCATVIADTLDLRSEVACLDLNASARSGTLGLAAACDFVRAGTYRNVLVVAADTRLARPGDGEEFLAGHGGVAVLVGLAEDSRVEILDQTHYQTSQADVWRAAGARFVTAGDVRFSRLGAYARPMQSVLDGILKAAGWSPADVARAVLYSPDVKSGAGLLKKNGFDVKRQYCDRVSARMGLTGTAHTLLMLVAALEESKAGDRLVALDHGDGAGAFALVVHHAGGSRLFDDAVSQGYDVSYNHYLALRGLHAGAETSDAGFTSEVMAERQKRLWRGLVGRRCLSCETVITLPLPTCPRCSKATEFAEFALQRRGEVFAVTHEHYFPTPEPPLGMAAVHLEGGGRLTLQVADEDVPVKVGDKVGLVFRRLHDAGKMPNYFWKCRPVRAGRGGAA